MLLKYELCKKVYGKDKKSRKMLINANEKYAKKSPVRKTKIILFLTQTMKV